MKARRLVRERDRARDTQYAQLTVNIAGPILPRACMPLFIMFIA